MPSHSTLLIALTAFFALTTALPAAEANPDPQVSTQEVTTFTACTDTNFGGRCKSWQITTQTQCIGVANTDFNDVASSVRVQSGFRCRLWSSNVCNGDSTPDIYAPGAAQLPSNMDNKMTSFKCYRN